ncbi:hypothetical protein K474DRAFT_1679822 [Panus rudis PR-1116 ss-1]|nr:hypothetical protein K474DRAFT_1679822 [Panus rudis PR-1116 ss-1]
MHRGGGNIRGPAVSKRLKPLLETAAYLEKGTTFSVVIYYTSSRTLMCQTNKLQPEAKVPRDITTSKNTAYKHVCGIIKSGRKLRTPMERSRKRMPMEHRGVHVRPGAHGMSMMSAALIQTGRPVLTEQEASCLASRDLASNGLGEGDATARPVAANKVTMVARTNCIYRGTLSEAGMVLKLARVYTHDVVQKSEVAC